MRLGQIRQPRGAHRQRKRLGQGVGSGTGKTSGRGHKGQRARSGGARGRRTGFEGGQMPLHRRIPKIGFTNPFRKVYQIVNLEAIERCGLEGVIGPQELQRAGLIRKAALPVKVLGEGEFTRNVTIRAHQFSQSARDKIAQAGGKTEVI